jgi:dynein heavy chain, axonemal
MLLSTRELEFQEDLSITAMISLEGEKIPLDTPVVAGGEYNGVERWLLALEDQMHKSLHSITKDAMQVCPPHESES